jgi:hypothetical protein
MIPEATIALVSVGKSGRGMDNGRAGDGELSVRGNAIDGFTGVTAARAGDGRAGELIEPARDPDMTDEGDFDRSIE